jgi:hypothetical protein
MELIYKGYKIVGTGNEIRQFIDNHKPKLLSKIKKSDNKYKPWTNDNYRFIWEQSTRVQNLLR